MRAFTLLLIGITALGGTESLAAKGKRGLAKKKSGVTCATIDADSDAARVDIISVAAAQVSKEFEVDSKIISKKSDGWECQAYFFKVAFDGLLPDEQTKLKKRLGRVVFDSDGGFLQTGAGSDADLKDHGYYGDTKTRDVEFEFVANGDNLREGSYVGDAEIQAYFLAVIYGKNDETLAPQGKTDLKKILSAAADGRLRQVDILESKAKKAEKEAADLEAEVKAGRKSKDRQTVKTCHAPCTTEGGNCDITTFGPLIKADVKGLKIDDPIVWAQFEDSKKPFCVYLADKVALGLGNLAPGCEKAVADCGLTKKIKELAPKKQAAIALRAQVKSASKSAEALIDEIDDFAGSWTEQSGKGETGRASDRRAKPLDEAAESSRPATSAQPAAP